MNINVASRGLAKTTAAPFEVERLGARLGAEIHGLDLKKGMDPATFKALEAALIEHKVIVAPRPAPRHRGSTSRSAACSASSKCIRCGRRASSRKSSCSTTTRTIRCCRPTSGTATRRSGKNPTKLHDPALPDHAEGRRRHAVGRHGSGLRGLERRVPDDDRRSARGARLPEFPRAVHEDRRGPGEAAQDGGAVPQSRRIRSCARIR